MILLGLFGRRWESPHHGPAKEHLEWHPWIFIIFVEQLDDRSLLGRNLDKPTSAQSLALRRREALGISPCPALTAPTPRPWAGIGSLACMSTTTLGLILHQEYRNPAKKNPPLIPSFRSRPDADDPDSGPPGPMTQVSFFPLCEIVGPWAGTKTRIFFGRALISTSTTAALFRPEASGLDTTPHLD